MGSNLPAKLIFNLHVEIFIKTIENIIKKALKSLKSFKM